MSSDFDRFFTQVTVQNEGLEERKDQENPSAAPPEESDATEPNPAFDYLTREERKNTGEYLERAGIGIGESDRGEVPQEEDGQEGSPLFREG